METPLWPCTGHMPLFSIDFRRASQRKTGDDVPQSVNSSQALSPLQPDTIDSVIKFLGSHEIIGLHNVLEQEVKDLMELLNANVVRKKDKWAYVGIDGKDGESSVEHSPILYRQSKWQPHRHIISRGATTLELQSATQDADRTRAFTAGCLKHRQTGKYVNVLHMNINRRYSADTFELVESVLGEPFEVSTRNTLLKTREQACSKSVIGGSDSKIMEEVCQFLTQSFIPFYDAMSAKHLEEDWEEFGVSSQSEGSQNQTLDRIPSPKQDHKTAEIVKEDAHGFRQDVCYAKDSPFLSPRSFELLANTSGEGMCYWKDQPATTDVDLWTKPSSWESRNTFGVIALVACILAFFGFCQPL